MKYATTHERCEELRNYAALIAARRAVRHAQLQLEDSPQAFADAQAQLRHAAGQEVDRLAHQRMAAQRSVNYCAAYHAVLDENPALAKDYVFGSRRET